MVLCKVTHKPKPEELEFNDEQIARVDEVYNAVYDMCRIITGKDDLEYNMSYLGSIAEGVVDTLLYDKNINIDKIHFPAIITYHDGTQKFEEYYKKRG